MLKPAKSRTKQGSSFNKLSINRLSQTVVIQEEPFEYLVRIVSKSITSFELSLLKKTLLELEIAKAIIECSFDGFTKHLISF